LGARAKAFRNALPGLSLPHDDPICGIVHRDIKPEIIPLLTRPTAHAEFVGFSVATVR